MKKIFFIACIVFLKLQASAGNVPAIVQKAFEQKFSKASNVKWVKENAHEYEANFELTGQKYSANFSDTGNWLETESPIAFNDLPEKVKTSFTATHKGAKVKATAKIENAKGEIKYEVEMKQGIKTLELFYNSDGTKTN